MALPNILRKLFQNDGAGDKLREDIIPTDTSLSSSSTAPIANSTVNSALANYLPLSGGTMTNALVMQTGSSGQQYLFSSNYLNGCTIYPRDASGGNGEGTGLHLFGHSNSNADSLIGAILLRASMPSTGFALDYPKTDLTIYPNGTIAQVVKTDSSSSWSGNIRSITASSYTSTSWYRKWSDGFIEQGGTVVKGSVLKVGEQWNTYISFPMAFSSRYEQIILQPKTYGHSLNYAINQPLGVFILDASTLNFRFNVTNRGTADTVDSIGLYWYACGY